MEICLKETKFRLAALAILLGVAQATAMCAAQKPAETTAATAGPPPSSGGFFPLSEVRRGMIATAWTVFTGTKPEPMQVEILGVLRGARGPGEDMILAQLLGAKPEYTGVVAGMSGSPVYIGNRLLGSLSYRIGQFSKDPIAGITPIAQMLEVRNLPIESGLTYSASMSSLPGLSAAGTGTAGTSAGATGQAAASTAAESPQAGFDGQTADGTNFQAMETPLVMGGFRPEAVRLWQKQMAGSSLEMVTAGGMGGSSSSGGGVDAEPVASAEAAMLPGSAVSAQLVRGDLEIAATCTVTYIDPKQLLACGHPILQAGPVSMPMTTAEVVTTLASPLNAFKIVNTGETIGAFTQDRDAAIRGVLGARARMIPMHIAVDGPGIERKLSVEILDLPSLTPQAMLVVLYDSLLQSNDSSADTSYHVTGNIDLEGYPPSPLDLWVSAGDAIPAPLQAALLAAERFQRLYSNGARQGAVRAINLHVDAFPRRIDVELEAARLVSNNIVHAGDTVMVEATLRPWHEPARNVRIPVKLPARLGTGNLRLLVSDAGTLDRTLDQPRLSSRPADLNTVLAELRGQHATDRVYVSLLVPESQAGMGGETLPGLPLSMTNALEPLRAAKDVALNGESAEVTGDAPAGGVLSGFQILSLHIEAGGGLD